MTSRSFRRNRGPRRAAAIDAAQILAPNSAPGERAPSLVGQGLAALAVSALGLALAASVTLTAAAQAEVTSSSTVAGQGNPDSTQAQPAPPAPERQGEQAVEHDAVDNSATPDGALGAFGRAAADGTSRNAVRAEIDRAVADQKARERGATLALAEEKQSQSSGSAVQDARSTNLVNTAEAAKREQARLAEEKRKAEEALKRAQEAAAAGRPAAAAPAAPAGTSSLPAQPNPSTPDKDSVFPGAPEAAPAAPGGAVKPMASYSRGAGWGAVGSWSRYHTGIDLSAPIGTPIRAVASGVVVSPNAGGWAGNHVIIRHGDGTYTLYAHMSHSAVRPGQMVNTGQSVGAVGMTGRTFGPHLHFEHYPASGQTSNPYSSDDPYRWMLSKGIRL